MEQSIQQFLERMQTSPKRLGIKELREREEIWRGLWSWIDEEVKYFILRVGSMVRIVRRDYKGSLGELGAVKFKLDEIEVTVYEKLYNQTDNKFYFETKIIKIPAGAIMMQEFILERELAEEVVTPEVMSLEALAEPSLHNLES